MKLRRIAWMTSVIPIALAIWAIAVEPASLRNETSLIHPSGWPAPCHGLRVAVLADLHVGSPFNGTVNGCLSEPGSVLVDFVESGFFLIVE
jgi:hypothetical protein